MEKSREIHNIPPLYDKNARVLILGSFPSVKSRQAAFFYAHPQNRFWPTLATLFGEETPKTVEEKRSLALRHGVALWDTIGSCEIPQGDAMASPCGIPSVRVRSWARQTRASQMSCRTICASF